MVWSGLRGTQCRLMLNITGDPCVAWKMFFFKVKLKLWRNDKRNVTINFALDTWIRNWSRQTMLKNARDTWHFDTCASLQSREGSPLHCPNLSPRVTRRWCSQQSRLATRPDSSTLHVIWNCPNLCQLLISRMGHFKHTEFTPCTALAGYAI